MQLRSPSMNRQGFDILHWLFELYVVAAASFPPLCPEVSLQQLLVFFFPFATSATKTHHADGQVNIMWIMT